MGKMSLKMLDYGLRKLIITDMTYQLPNVDELLSQLVVEASKRKRRSIDDATPKEWDAVLKTKSKRPSHD